MTLNPIEIYKKLINNPKTKWFTIIVTVIYVVSPIDFIPDVFPFLGWLDDGFLTACLIIALKSLGDKGGDDKGPVVGDQ
jgi:uncharacterized membrane protein YkvA (DUF1232 family)